MSSSTDGTLTGRETPRYDRRLFIRKAGGFALTTAVLATDIFTPRASFALAGRRTISIGTFAPSHCSIPMVYAQLHNYFKEAGLQVNQSNYTDMTLLAKDLLSGKLDFGQLVVPLVFAIHTGQNTLGLKEPMAICQITGTNGAALMVKKGSGITSPEDFKGKTMANHSKLSVHYLINRMFLETHGLDFQRDVNFKVITLGDAVKAMETGEVDTFVMPEPRDAVVEAKGVGDVYLLSKYIWPNHPCCSLVTRKELFDKEKDLVTDVTRAVTKSGLFVNQPHARELILDTLQSVPDYQFDKVPKEVLKKAFTPGRSDFYPFPYQSTAMLIIEIMKKYDLLAADLDPRQTAEQVFQSDLSRQVMLDLGADPPATNYRVEKILGALKDYT
ncbi:MAG: ABC transporter substrate-binding protein, partial [Desulfobulbaceae bacterium]